MKRKVIQITSAGVMPSNETQCSQILHALCDDGSVWYLRFKHEDWKRLPDIPQDDEARESEA